MSFRRHVFVCLSLLLVLAAGGRTVSGQPVAGEPDPVLNQLDVRISNFLEGVSVEGLYAWQRVSRACVSWICAPGPVICWWLPTENVLSVSSRGWI